MGVTDTGAEVCTGAATASATTGAGGVIAGRTGGNADGVAEDEEAGLRRFASRGGLGFGTRVPVLFPERVRVRVGVELAGIRLFAGRRGLGVTG